MTLQSVPQFRRSAAFAPWTAPPFVAVLGVIVLQQQAEQRKARLALPATQT